MPEQGLAFLFNTHRGLLIFADDYDMHFEDWLIEQPQRPFDWLVVDLDQQTAEELVEVVFEAISFFFSNFNCEFHKLYLSKNYIRDQLEQGPCQSDSRHNQGCD